MLITNKQLPEQANTEIIVHEVDTHKQYPHYSITAHSTCDAVMGFTVNGYRTAKRRMKLADINTISGVDAGGGASYQWYGSHSYDRIFGPLAESKAKDVQHCIIYTNDGEIIIIDDDIRDFGMYDWDVKPSYDGEQIDAIFLSKVNRIDGDIAYVPRDNAVGRGFTLPPGVINPDIEGRFTTALFLPELYKDEQGIIHKVKSKILASVIKSVHLKSQFSPVQLSTWPANVREMFGALVVLNNGRLIYTTQGSFSTLLWVRPAQTRKTEGTMLPAMPTMPLPNQGAMTTTPPTNGGMFDTSVLRNRLAAVLNKN